MGGTERGTYFLPENDDQLLVVFEHGDINRPIVIGALWSKKQEPVEVNESGKNNTKLIKSRAGHRIIFDDKEGAEKVTIVDKTKKNKIVLDTANEDRQDRVRGRHRDQGGRQRHHAHQDAEGRHEREASRARASRC